MGGGKSNSFSEQCMSGSARHRGKRSADRKGGTERLCVRGKKDELLYPLL